MLIWSTKYRLIRLYLWILVVTTITVFYFAFYDNISLYYKLINFNFSVWYCILRIEFLFPLESACYCRFLLVIELYFFDIGQFWIELWCSDGFKIYWIFDLFLTFIWVNLLEWFAWWIIYIYYIFFCNFVYWTEEGTHAYFM